MAEPRTVVFGDDRSPDADVAWLFVNNQTWPGWRIEVVTAQPPDRPGTVPADRAALHPWDPPRARTAFAEAQFTEVVQLTAEADPREVLARASDLLVIGPRGPGLLKALRLGSTAEWLMAHPPAPMVIARRGDTVHRVLLAVDGSPHSRLAAQVLAGLPWISGVEVAALAVDDYRTDVKTATADAASALEGAGASVTTVIEPGNPTKVINQHLETDRPDLVALGTRGLTGFRRLSLGSTAGAVGRAADCSVLLACDDSSDPATVR